MSRPHIELRPCEERRGLQGLTVEGVSLERLVAHGFSPVYVTSLSAVAQRVREYLGALRQHFPKGNVYYAVKANFARPVLEQVLAAGGCVDIVSIGEWRAVRAAGFAGAQVCFAGVGKRSDEWKEAILGGVGVLNVEHTSELEQVLDFLLALSPLKEHVSPLVAVRLNPCVESDTHPHLRTGALDSKFGMLQEQLQNWVVAKRAALGEKEWARYVKPFRGIHVHIGSQLHNPEIYKLVVQKVFECAVFLTQNDVVVNNLDLGGGLGVGFNGVPHDASDIQVHVDFLASTLKVTLAEFSALQKLWGLGLERANVSLEPGRSVVASSTVFLSKVLYEKSNASEHHFVYVDGAMNDFPRPSLYDARHEVALADACVDARLGAMGDTSTSEQGRVKASSKENDGLRYKIVGPVCESGDVLAKDVFLPRIKPGDWLVFFEAGAYCRSMASHYNLRPLPAQIFVRDEAIVEVISPCEPQF